MKSRQSEKEVRTDETGQREQLSCAVTIHVYIGYMYVYVSVCMCVGYGVCLSVYHLGVGNNPN